MNTNKPFYQTTFFHLLLMLAAYLTLKYFIPYGRLILYPVTLLVTFLHEFGHAAGAILTGGKVLGIQVNPDGSGYTRTIGGWRPLVIMGGYVGSALFGNLLFYLGIKKPKWSHYTLYVLAATMVFTAFWWFNSVFSSLILILFAGALIFIAQKIRWTKETVLFLALAALLYIIEDFRVGPSSDLTQMTAFFVIIPKIVWQYFWWFLVLWMCYINFRRLLKHQKSHTNHTHEPY